MVFPLGSCSVNYHSICFPSQALSRCHNPHRTTILHAHSPQGQPSSTGGWDLPDSCTLGQEPDLTPKLLLRLCSSSWRGKAQTIRRKSWHLRNSLIVYKTSLQEFLCPLLWASSIWKLNWFPSVLHLERPCGVQAQSIGLGTLEPKVNPGSASC